MYLYRLTKNQAIRRAYAPWGKDILWRGEVQWFAKSSGTTNDKSKFIPVSRDGLHDIHYAGGMDAVALYLQQILRVVSSLERPDSRREPCTKL